MAKADPPAGTVRIKWYRSTICTPEKHKTIVRSLGLTKLNQVVERPDTPDIRGMVAKVPHLLRIIE
jgi:large subunit ribosomal protein L30